MEEVIDKQKLIKAWAYQYRQMSETKEHAAFIYSNEEEGVKKYYVGHTYAGFSKNGPFQPNVIIPFVYFYIVESIIEWFRKRAEVECFIHTHPKPEKGFTNRQFSNVDMKLLHLKRIKLVCVVPFENNEINFIR